jgi:ribosomal protein S12 methylthiotransferase accessory factor
LLDISNDLKIPCYAAVSARIRSANPDYLFGLGAHLDPAVAAIRAVTEMNQFLNVHRAGHEREMDLSFVRPRSVAALILSGWSRTNEDAGKSVKLCVALAKSRDLETLVLDQTRKDVGLPVVKVIIPGMRQLWARFSEGRLYDVPVQLGWIKKRLQERQLNQSPFPKLTLGSA